MGEQSPVLSHTFPHLCCTEGVSSQKLILKFSEHAHILLHRATASMQFKCEPTKSMKPPSF
jgi:hypothetical protein